VAKTASGYEQFANRSTSQSTGATGNRSPADSPTSTAPLPNCPKAPESYSSGSTGLVQLVSKCLERARVGASWSLAGPGPEC
jgi:hypothetical protein